MVYRWTKSISKMIKKQKKIKEIYKMWENDLFFENTYGIIGILSKI